MKISITPHKNTIFFFTLLNLIGYDRDNNKPLHSLREKVRTDFVKYKDSTDVKTIKAVLNTNKRPLHPYPFAQLSIFTNDGLELRTDLTDWKLNRSLADKYEAEIKELAQRIKKAMDFDKYYQETFLPLYESLCKQVSELLSGEEDVIAVLSDFWQIDTGLKYVLIPNPLIEVRRGHAVEREGKVYAFVGPDYSKKTEETTYTKFRTVHLLAHEYSHASAARVIDTAVDTLKDDALDTYNKQLKAIRAAGIASFKKHGGLDFTNGYNSPRMYIEENFVRAATLFLELKLLGKELPQEKKDAYAKKYIESQTTKNNMIMVNAFYKDMQKREESEQKTTLTEIFLKAVQDFNSQ